MPAVVNDVWLVDRQDDFSRVCLRQSGLVDVVRNDAIVVGGVDEAYVEVLRRRVVGHGQEAALADHREVVAKVEHGVSGTGVREVDDKTGALSEQHRSAGRVEGQPDRLLDRTDRLPSDLDRVEQGLVRAGDGGWRSGRRGDRLGLWLDGVGFGFARLVVG